MHHHRQFIGVADHDVSGVPRGRVGHGVVVRLLFDAVCHSFLRRCVHSAYRIAYSALSFDHAFIQIQQLQVLLRPFVCFLEYFPAVQDLILGALQLHGLFVKPLLYLNLLGIVGFGGDTVVAQLVLDLH